MDLQSIYNAAKKTADFVILDDVKTLKTALDRGKYTKEDLKASARLGVKGVGAAALSTVADVYANMPNLRYWLYDNHLYIPGATMHDIQNYLMNAGIQPGMPTDIYSTVVGGGLLLLSAGTYLSKRKSKKNNSPDRHNLGPEDVWEAVKKCPVSAGTAALGLLGAAGVGNIVDKLFMYGTPSPCVNPATNASAAGNATNASTAVNATAGNASAVNATATPYANVTNATIGNATNSSYVFGRPNPFYVPPFRELFAAAGTVALAKSGSDGVSTATPVSTAKPQTAATIGTSFLNKSQPEITYSSAKSRPMDYKEYYSTYMRS